MKITIRLTLMYVFSCCWFLANSAAMAEECEISLVEGQLTEILQSNNSSFQKTDEIFAHVRHRMDAWTTISRTEGLEAIVRFVAYQLVTGNQNGAAAKTHLESATMVACMALGEGDERIEAADRASEAAGVGAPMTERQLAQIGDIGDARNYVRLYTGVGYLLDADGKWDSNGEIAFVSAHNWAPHGGDLRRQLRGIAEFEFTEFSATDEMVEDVTAGEQETATNPFQVGGGIFRFNGSLHYRLSREFRLVGGLGFTTLPITSGSSSKGEGRYFLGGRIDNPTLGADREAYLALGVAKDSFWKFNEIVDMNGTETVRMVDERERVFVEGRLTIPGVFGDGNVWLSARVFADLPASGDGPSDVRVSLHVSTDLNRLWNR